MDDIFDLPRVVQERVTLGEVLAKLRTMVNKHYMPSADGTTSCNRKPTYVRSACCEEFPEFPMCDDTQYEDGSYLDDHAGFIAFEEGPCQNIFVRIPMGKFLILIDLTTERAIVRHVDYPEWVLWPYHMHALSIDRVVYSEFCV